MPLIVQRRCTSCCLPVENIPLQAEHHSGRRAKLFAFPPERCSPSERNAVRIHNGMVFAFDRIPQSERPQPQIAKERVGGVLDETRRDTPEVVAHLGGSLRLRLSTNAFSSRRLLTRTEARCLKSTEESSIPLQTIRTCDRIETASNRNSWSRKSGQG
jgi:hypothetical protein